MRNLKALFVLIIFIFTNLTPPNGWAQVIASKANSPFITALGLMPSPGRSVSLSAGFDLAHFKGMVIDPKDPFKFDFIVHQGDERRLTDHQKQLEYTKLIKYFLAALAVPDTDQWVNLSPYEKDRIIAVDFGKTAMGRDLLAQDYLLKQLSSSLTNPETGLGQKFWNKVYDRVYQEFGRSDVPLNTFNKVWIIPDKAVIYEHGNMMYVISSHLKVMTEEDYLAKKKHQQDHYMNEEGKSVNISNRMMREIIIPAIEQEVNEGKNFAPLRQVLSGMLLATWYKRALKESILARLYANKGKLKGVDQDPKINEKIYQAYLKAYKKGVYNMIKEETDPVTQEVIPRKYFSGGFNNRWSAAMISGTKAAAADDVTLESSDMVTVRTQFTKFTELGQGIVRGGLKQLPKIVFGGMLVAKTFTAQADSVTLGWDAPVNTSTLAGYKLYLATDSQTFSLGTSVGMVNEGVIGGLQAGTTYEFVATAVDTNGNESPYSNMVIYQMPLDFQMGNGTPVYQLSGTINPGDVMTVTSTNSTITGTVDNSTGLLTLSTANQYTVATVTVMQNGNVFQTINVRILPTPSFVLGTPVIKNAGPFNVNQVPVSVPNGYPGQVYKGQLQWSATPDFRNMVPVTTFNALGTLSQTITDVRPNGPAGFYRVLWLNQSAHPTASIKNNFMKGAELLVALHKSKEKPGLTWTPIAQNPKLMASLKAQGHKGMAQLKSRGFQKLKQNVPINQLAQLNRNNQLKHTTQRRPAFNSAQIAATPEGGIDFAQSNLDMQIKRDGKGIVLPVSQQNLDNIHIDGLIPVILGIKPVEATLLFGKNAEGDSLI